MAQLGISQVCAVIRIRASLAGMTKESYENSCRKVLPNFISFRQNNHPCHVLATESVLTESEYFVEEVDLDH